MMHTPIADVLAMDGIQFKAAAAEAERAQWEPLHDLLATQAEIMHGIWRLLVGALTKTKPPEALRIPRPDRDVAQPKPDRRIAMTAGDFARLISGRGG